MNETVFIRLFHEACERCFGQRLIRPLSETESKVLSNQIFEFTGLVIGAKSIKNYSRFVLGLTDQKHENPSEATLDTFARYVLKAPHTDEIQRKKTENHFPWWFQYQNSQARLRQKPLQPSLSKIYVRVFLFSLLAGILILAIIIVYPGTKDQAYFEDNFNSLDADSLSARGWILKSPDVDFWNQRYMMPGYLTLFTLRGDNWRNQNNPAVIHNLLIRKTPGACFSTEVHLNDFIPLDNWQQAGLLIMEDSTFNGKMVRLSISYNNFFGGYKKSPEIVIQAVSSTESGTFSKPEEISHQVLFTLDPGSDSLVRKNLSLSALKIEKKGQLYRFLFASGPSETFAFREIARQEVGFTPKFIGIFAISGWADSSANMPVHFDSFICASIHCKN